MPNPWIQKRRGWLALAMAALMVCAMMAAVPGMTAYNSAEAAGIIIEDKSEEDTFECGDLLELSVDASPNLERVEAGTELLYVWYGPDNNIIAENTDTIEVGEPGEYRVEIKAAGKDVHYNVSWDVTMLLGINYRINITTADGSLPIEKPYRFELALFDNNDEPIEGINFYNDSNIVDVDKDGEYKGRLVLAFTSINGLYAFIEEYAEEGFIIRQLIDDDFGWEYSDVWSVSSISVKKIEPPLDPSGEKVYSSKNSGSPVGNTLPESGTLFNTVPVPIPLILRPLEADGKPDTTKLPKPYMQFNNTFGAFEVEVPVTKVIEKKGDIAPDQDITFGFEMCLVIPSTATAPTPPTAEETALSSATLVVTAAEFSAMDFTSGSDSVKGFLTFILTKDEYDSLLNGASKEFFIREVKGSEPGWTYDDAEWLVRITGKDAASGKDTFVFYDDPAQASDPTHNGKTEMVFANQYDRNNVVTPTPPEPSEEPTPTPTLTPTTPPPSASIPVTTPSPTPGEPTPRPSPSPSVQPSVVPSNSPSPDVPTPTPTLPGSVPPGPTPTPTAAPKCTDDNCTTCSQPPSTCPTAMPSPKTGDTTNMPVLMLICMLSIVAMVGVCHLKKHLDMAY